MTDTGQDIEVNLSCGDTITVATRPQIGAYRFCIHCDSRKKVTGFPSTPKGTPMNTFAAGTRVISPNGSAGTVIGPMTAEGGIVAIKLDNGRQVSGLVSKCKPETPPAPTMLDLLAAAAAVLQKNALTEKPLPVPGYVTVSETGSIGFQFQSHDDVADWAEFFGTSFNRHEHEHAIESATTITHNGVHINVYRWEDLDK